MRSIFFLIPLILAICKSTAFSSSPFGGKRAVTSKSKIPSSPPTVTADGRSAKSAENEIQAPKDLNILDLCLCGAFATAFGDFAMHPVDTIKINQQTATAAANLFVTAKTIFLAKGILGFYPGVLPYLIGDGISGAIKFSVFEITNKFAEKQFPARFYGLIQFICAAIAMVTASLTLVPAEIIKTRLQAGSSISLFQVIETIFHSEGVRGFFVGFYATLIRDVPYTMLELGIYENLKRLIRHWKGKELTARDELVAAGITGGIAAFVTTPLDLVKTKLMMQNSDGGRYAGVLDALSGIYQGGGMMALFVGSAARVAWLIPFTTIYLGVYEAAKKRIKQYRETKH